MLDSGLGSWSNQALLGFFSKHRLQCECGSPSIVPPKSHRRCAPCADLNDRCTRYEGEITILNNIIGKVERKRASYPHIDDAELARRKESVAALRTSLAAVKNSMASKQYQAKIDADRKQVTTRCIVSRSTQRPCL